MLRTMPRKKALPITSKMNRSPSCCQSAAKTTRTVLSPCVGWPKLAKSC
jgi:hypothetical protein